MSTLRRVTPDAFLRFALDPARLAVLGSLASGWRTIDELVALVGRRRREVLTWVGGLAADGLVEVAGRTYRVRAEALRELAAALPQPEPPAPDVFFGMTHAEQQVLRRFVSGRRLVEVPSSRSRRLVVLERLALEFDPGRRYPEAEVNAILGRWHEDWSALRRYLVDEGFLDRADNVYWRAGGRVEDPPPAPSTPVEAP